MKRQDAIRLGLSTYPADAPCKLGGHLGERYISGRCVECARLSAEALNKSTDVRTMSLRRLRAVATLKDRKEAGRYKSALRKLPETPSCVCCGSPMTQSTGSTERRYCSAECHARAISPVPYGKARHKAKTGNRKATIKEFACELFVRVNYIDIDGRNVGYDYEFILAEVKKQFPKANTSKRWLRMMAYDLNGTVRMPVRRRSRYALARGYAMVLLLKVDAKGVGLPHRKIQERVRKKFPGYAPNCRAIKTLEVQLRHREFVTPPRPDEA